MSRCDDFLKQYYGVLSFRDYTLLDRSVRTLEANAADTPSLCWKSCRLTGKSLKSRQTGICQSKKYFSALYCSEIFT